MKLYTYNPIKETEEKIRNNTKNTSRKEEKIKNKKKEKKNQKEKPVGTGVATQTPSSS